MLWGNSLAFIITSFPLKGKLCPESREVVRKPGWGGFDPCPRLRPKCPWSWHGTAISRGASLSPLPAPPHSGTLFRGSYSSTPHDRVDPRSAPGVPTPAQSGGLGWARRPGGAVLGLFWAFPRCALGTC